MLLWRLQEILWKNHKNPDAILRGENPIDILKMDVFYNSQIMEADQMSNNWWMGKVVWWIYI